MVDKMVKKWSWKRFYISCNYSCISYFLVKILLANLLNYCTTKQRLQRWWNLSKLVTDTFVNFVIFFNFIILSPLFLLRKKYPFGKFPFAWKIMIKTCGRVLLGGMSTNEQTPFFDSQMYLQ